MRVTNPIAKIGEELAAEYLRKKGYKIIDRNFRKGYGEVDIVAIEDPNSSEKTLVFVEVKTRTSNLYGSPLEAINYKLIHPNLPDALRIDAISVELFHANKPKEIKHIKNIST